MVVMFPHPVTTCQRKIRTPWGSPDGEQVTEISYGGYVIANAMEYLVPDGDCLQMLLCNECWCTGCADGGWISLRRIGRFVAFVPCWERLSGRDGYRFGPPLAIAEVGPPVLNPTEWKHLQELAPKLPNADDLPALSTSDVGRWVTMSAPYNPTRLDDPRWHQAMEHYVEASNTPNWKELLHHLGIQIASWIESPRPVVITAKKEIEEQFFEIWVEDQNEPWKPVLGLVPSDWSVHWAGGTFFLERPERQEQQES